MHKGAQGGYRNNRNTRSVDKKTEKRSPEAQRRPREPESQASQAGVSSGLPLGATPPLEEGEGWCGRRPRPGREAEGTRPLRRASGQFHLYAHYCRRFPTLSLDCVITRRRSSPAAVTAWFFRWTFSLALPLPQDGAASPGLPGRGTRPDVPAQRAGLASRGVRGSGRGFTLYPSALAALGPSLAPPPGPGYAHPRPSRPPPAHPLPSRPSPAHPSPRPSPAHPLPFPRPSAPLPPPAPPPPSSSLSIHGDLPPPPTTQCLPLASWFRPYPPVPSLTPCPSTPLPPTTPRPPPPPTLSSPPPAYPPLPPCLYTNHSHCVSLLPHPPPSPFTPLSPPPLPAPPSPPSLPPSSPLPIAMNTSSPLPLHLSTPPPPTPPLCLSVLLFV
ncbi:hypothetical protein C7M84_022403 [Penaeus vannamei]|uniref:Uncharacterized protein n=1 Tax=Penaeus vannamei TaxID=6689 RepID=A0A423U6T9_PENVA|nr:hypothetical protein C7M84_022403 [Penaeus vannamei]